MFREKIGRAIKKVIRLIVTILDMVIIAIAVYVVFYEMALFVNYLVPLP